MIFLRLLLLLGIGLDSCRALKILVIWQHNIKSHFFVFEDVFKNLALRGHEVTVISYFPRKIELSNYRDVSLLSGEENNTGIGVHHIDKLKSPRLEMYGTTNFLAALAEATCPNFVSHPNVLNLIAENNSYDLILTEMFNTNCQNGLVKILGAPVVGMSTCLHLPWLNPMFGLPDNPAYVPNPLLDHSDHMSFFERVENSVLLVFHKLMYDILMRRPGNELTKKHLGVDVITETDLDYSASLLLSNTHFSFTRPRPLTPNVIEVAGIHIGQQKPLPKDLKKYVTDSSHGVVYMSMGSMLKGTSFPREKQEQFLKAFSKIKQNVIWKWENDTMDQKPDNVLLAKWTPQRDLLCHPNLKAFISHGGLLGTIESVHCGVPMLVIPQFGDQYANAALIEENGFGLKMLLSDVTEDIILRNLKTVLSDKYRKQAQEVSRRFKDRPQPPVDTAIYWIEYVAKYGGAKFMRTAAVDMPFYQYYLLDVTAFLIAFVLISVFVITRIVKFFLNIIVFNTATDRKLKIN